MMRRIGLVLLNVCVTANIGINMAVIARGTYGASNIHSIIVCALGETVLGPLMIFAFCPRLHVSHPHISGALIIFIVAGLVLSLVLLVLSLLQRISVGV
jgi:hypothetical protein